MKAAPGAQLPPDQIFGRNAFIAALWRTLETNSVRMEAERRIGKTSILHKMQAEPANGWEAVYLDVESIRTPEEFAEKVCEVVHQRLTGWKKQAKHVSNFLSSLAGGQVFSVKFPEKKNRPQGYWKTLLTHAIKDLAEQRTSDKRIVFLFDEMPWMVASMADPKHGGSAAQAMQVLDLLRELRQAPETGPSFRMLLCGSIGMHHILDELQRQGHRNKPVNDLMLIEVPPLDADSAAELAGRLIAGERLTATAGTNRQIAEATGGFPYYTHWVVRRLADQGGTVTPAAVDAAVNWLLSADHDPCDFRHFRKRLPDYYPDHEKAVLAMLDWAVMASDPVPVGELINVAKTTGSIDDEQVRDLIRRLALDHYLTRNSDGRYTFRHALLQRWWKLDRGLD